MITNFCILEKMFISLNISPFNGSEKYPDHTNSQHQSENFSIEQKQKQKKGKTKHTHYIHIIILQTMYFGAVHTLKIIVE